MATGKPTPIIKLPTYAPNDKVVMGDFNQVYNAIDAAVGGFVDNTAEAIAKADEAITTAKAANDAVVGVVADAKQAVTDAADAKTTAEDALQRAINAWGMAYNADTKSDVAKGDAADAKLEAKKALDTANDVKSEFDTITSNVITIIQNTMMATLYPVGYIISSTKPLDPRAVTGVGTWRRIEAKFLAAAKDGDTNFAPGKTGGAITTSFGLTKGFAQVTLESNAHIYQNRQAAPGFDVDGWNATIESSGTIPVSGTSTRVGTVTPLGGRTDSGSILPVYQAVYMYERIS